MNEYQDIAGFCKENNVQLLAVSKRQPLEKILALHEIGHRAFAENRVQDLVEKRESLPSDIQWDFIGKLQKNKVKYIIDFIHMIHSVDSFKLLDEIEKRAAKIDRVIPVLLQFKIGQEETKTGFSYEGFYKKAEKLDSYRHVEFHGVMGIGTFTEDKELKKTEFNSLASINQTLKAEFFANNDMFKEISMGMSADYKLAIAHGSTMVRLGSVIFGARNY